MKEEFVVGDYIKIVQMDGESNYSNKEGYILFIDDIGQLHGTWGGCAIRLDIDKVIIIKETIFSKINN